jgi:hypothetical protein
LRVGYAFERLTFCAGDEYREVNVVADAAFADDLHIGAVA